MHWNRYGVLDNTTTCIYTVFVIIACTCTRPLGTKMEMESLLVSLEEAEEEQLSSPPTHPPEQLPPLAELSPPPEQLSKKRRKDKLM